MQKLKSVGQLINESRQFLGDGTFQALAPVLTQRGLDAGWRYTYPEMLNLGGVNFSRFTTLDEMLSEGLIELKMQTKTLV